MAVGLNESNHQRDEEEEGERVDCTLEDVQSAARYVYHDIEPCVRERCYLIMRILHQDTGSFFL